MRSREGAVALVRVFPGTRLRAPAVRTWLAGVVALLATGSVYVGTAGTARANDICPNTDVRVGFSATLPGCRAYEQVSGEGVEPYFTTSAQEGNVGLGSRVVGESFAVEAAVSGDRLGFFSIYTPPPGSPSDGPYFLATRGTAGWSTENIVPPQSTTNTGRTCFNAFVERYSPDLSTAVFADGWGQEGHPFGTSENNCGTDEPTLVPGEPEGFQNLFVRDTAASTYRLVNQTPTGVVPDHAFYQATSDDISHVVFDERAALTPEAPAGDNLYEWVGAPGATGTVRLVTWLPDGTPVQGTLANADEPELLHSKGLGAEQFTRAVSSDGRRLVFVTGGNLYERVNADRPQSTIQSGACTESTMACTYQVDAVQGGSSGGEGQFQWASADGTHVFFTDVNELAPGASSAPGEPDLYEYDSTKPPGSRLEDITELSGEHADVLGVAGMNETGEPASYVYFVADGVLSNAPNSHGNSAAPGQPNLYARHAGTTRFVATLDASGDSLDWNQNALTTRVSRGGEYVAFNSIRSLTGFDNTDVPTGEPDQEIYLYDAPHEKLNCVSCKPSGERPTAPARIYQPVSAELFYFTPGSLQRFVSDDGRVFFDTRDELLSAATNGLSNVYEYHEGSLSLISSGALNAPSYFYEASPSGHDVFFFTSGKLLPSVTDQAIHVYDARVDGGFKETPPSEPCREEACRGPGSVAPPALIPGSTIFPPLTPPGGPPAAKHGKIVKLKLSKHRASVSVALTVSGPGRIGVSGSGLRAARKSAVRAGTYALTLRLSAAAKGNLKRKGQLHLRIAVTFTPNGAGLERDHAITTLRRR